MLLDESETENRIRGLRIILQVSKEAAAESVKLKKLSDASIPSLVEWNPLIKLPSRRSLNHWRTNENAAKSDCTIDTESPSTDIGT